MRFKDKENQVTFNKTFSKQDWKDTIESAENLVKMVDKEDQEFYEDWFIRVFGNGKIDRVEKIKRLALIHGQIIERYLPKLMKKNAVGFKEYFSKLREDVGDKKLRELLGRKFNVMKNKK